MPTKGRTVLMVGLTVAAKQIANVHRKSPLRTQGVERTAEGQAHKRR